MNTSAEQRREPEDDDAEAAVEDEPRGALAFLRSASGIRPKRMRTALVRVADMTSRSLNLRWFQESGRLRLRSLGRKMLQSYGRMYYAKPEFFEPRSITDLQQFLEDLKRAHEAEDLPAGTRLPFITFRGRGFSFHNQSLNNEWVVSLRKLDRIETVDRNNRTVIVEPGAVWGEIVKATREHGLTPYVVVTNSESTAGGTLASDGISRHSPCYGSESSHVEWLELITPAHTQPRRLHRPSPDSDDDEAALFRAVIGGFGYLGVVSRICYRLIALPEQDDAKPSKPLKIRTELKSGDNFGELLKQLDTWRQEATLHDHKQVERWRVPEMISEEHPAIYAVAFLDRGDGDPSTPNDGRGAAYRSRYVRSEETKPYIVYQRNSLSRKVLELLASLTFFKRIGREFMWLQMVQQSEEKIFYDDVDDYLFFMDINRTIKRFSERIGFSLPVLQQTYVVPPANAETFLNAVATTLENENITPTLIDILFMPEDLILMSASHGQEGYACTFAFEDVRSKTKRSAAERLLSEFTSLCRSYGGRVHLTKNVYAKPEDLQHMYRGRADAFMDLKEQCDPHHIIRNAFFDDIFCECCDAAHREMALAPPSSRKRGRD